MSDIIVCSFSVIGIKSVGDDNLSWSKRERTMFKSILKKFIGEGGTSLRFRIIFAFCVVVHAFYSILFYSVEVYELMAFNIVSTTMYLIGLITVKNNRYTVLWLFLLNTEIILHGLLCSHYLGYDYQFALFSFSLIPVTYFLSYLDESFGHPIIVSSLLAAVNLAVMMFTLHMDSYTVPVCDDFPVEFLDIVAQLNLAIGVIILVSFSIMFISKINSDMKSLKESNEKLDFLANYDPLTGLRNRNNIRVVFSEYINSKDPYSVIIGDIDDFKKVNDTCGHNAGDAVLRKVSEIFVSVIAEKGVVCRWGGEEILVLLKGTTDQSIKTIEAVLKEIRNTTVVSSGKHIRVTMTFGMSDYTDAMNIEKLISIADKRLYIGKNSGKNRIVADDR